MDKNSIGAAIKTAREGKGLTQSELGNILGVSDKTVSKWETGRGYPDITLLEPISQELGISFNRLFSLNEVSNRNKCANMLKSKLYVCPLCGNVISAVGECSISCCGISLPAAEAEIPDGDHAISAERVEDEIYLTVSHPMTKEHYISFFALVQGDGTNIIKLYPEGEASARIKLRGNGILYYYCNRHGLFRLTTAALLKK